MKDITSLPADLSVPPLKSAMRELKDIAAGKSGYLSRTDAQHIVEDIDRLRAERNELFEFKTWYESR